MTVEMIVSSLHVPDEDVSHCVFWSPFTDEEMLQLDMCHEYFPVSTEAIDPSAPVAEPLTDRPPMTQNDKCVAPDKSTCPGCKKRRHRTDPSHTRDIAQCRYPWCPSFIPSCDACCQRRDRSDPNHSKDDGCRWSTQFTEWMTELHRTRPRLVPHIPGPPPHESDTAGMPASSGGQELGIPAEEQAAAAAAQGCPIGMEYRRSDQSVMREDRDQDHFLSPRAKNFDTVEFMSRCYVRITTHLHTGTIICQEYGVWLFSPHYLHRPLPHPHTDIRTEFLARSRASDLPMAADMPALPGLPKAAAPKRHPSTGPYWDNSSSSAGQAPAAPREEQDLRPSNVPARRVGRRIAPADQDRPDAEPVVVPHDPDPADWRRFNIGNVVRLFRSGATEAIKLTLRKLHVRWWHASARQMQTFLKRVGVPDAVLGMIPEVCSTCQVCREWQRPGNAHQTAIDLPDTFNQQVEGDIMFYDEHMIFHLLDRCTRWHAAMVLPDKTANSLMTAISTLWITQFGAPTEFIHDEERGITAELTQLLLATHGVKFVPKPDQKHAQYIERRGALLRDTLHRITSELRNRALDVPFPQVLAEAVFAGNALLTVNGMTPYNAVLGRTPPILPSLNQLEFPDQDKYAPGLIADSHKLREIAVEAMVQGSAQSRLNAALRTRTTMDAKTLNLKVGDVVDFYRSPVRKEDTGWFGPATVVDVSQSSRDIFSVRFATRIYQVSSSCIRRHLVFFVFLVSPRLSSTPTRAWNEFRNLVQACRPKVIHHVGSAYQRSTYHRTKEDKAQPSIFPRLGLGPPTN